MKEVPNAPCGVESRLLKRTHGQFSDVPNAPCGVESSVQNSIQLFTKLKSPFLMHRVELKVFR